MLLMPGHFQLAAAAAISIMPLMLLPCHADTPYYYYAADMLVSADSRDIDDAILTPPYTLRHDFRHY
jgi:hypothetical protein